MKGKSLGKLSVGESTSGQGDWFDEGLKRKGRK